jgi:asparagine synthase (glutamine-hydrolysing)
MCGLTAFFTVNGGSGCKQCGNDAHKVERQMEESLDIVNHRGPDARGRWFSPDHQVGKYSQSQY